MTKKICSIDCETISLTDKTMLAFSYCLDGEKEVVVPVRMNTTENMPIIKAILLLEKLIVNYEVIFHNSSFDIPVLTLFGVDFKLFSDIEDTVIIANLINENERHGLKQLTKKHFKHQMAEYKEVCGTGKKQISFADVPWDEAQKYAGEDAYYTLKLYKKLIKELKRDEIVHNLYKTVERPLLLPVAHMHCEGIRIDVKTVKEISDICTSKADLAKEKVEILIGEINLNSPKQLREYFIDKLHMPILKKSKKTNMPSVDKEVLDNYADNGNNEAKAILNYRKFAKILKTFIPALTPDNWNMVDWTGYIYANFNQAGTTSGRFSSSKPNMQNIPHVGKECKDCDVELIKKGRKWVCPKCKKSPDQFYLRDAIIADPGHVLIGADYSQIELRVLAHVSQDFALMKAYKEGVDIHKRTAEACHTTRYKAKTINFGIVYGMGAKTLSKRTNTTVEEAQDFIALYFNTYKGVKKFWELTEKQIRSLGYVNTVFGRKRRISQHFFAKDDFEQGGEVRSIINAIIQGTAADLMKMAIVSMHPQLRNLGARIISTVHDEVIISTPKDQVQKAYDIITKSMVESGKDLTVPIEVDAKIGNTWEEIH